MTAKIARRLPLSESPLSAYIALKESRHEHGAQGAVTGAEIQGRDRRLRFPSKNHARAAAPASQRALVAVPADLRHPPASRLRQGLSVPQGDPAGGAAR